MTVDLELCDRFVAFLAAYACGEAHAMTATTLIRALALEDTEQSRREIRACAQHAVRSGRLVCTGQRGYYVPASPSEVLASTRRLKSEAGELWRRARRVEQLAAEHFDLQELPEPDCPAPVLQPLLALMEG